MAKKIKAVVKVQIAAGKATAAPPVGTALGPHGINMGQFIKEYNERTASLAGTVVRLNLNVAPNGVTVASTTVIASGYAHRGDPAAFVVGPTGLVYDPNQDVLLWHPQKTMPYLLFRGPQQEPAVEAQARLFTQMPLTCMVHSLWLRLPMATCSFPTAT